MTRRARRQKGKGVKNKKRIWLICGISLAVVLLGFLIVYFVMRGEVNKVASDVIWDNIYVENVELSGMDEKEAREALETMADDYKAMEVKLVVEESQKTVHLGELGLKIKNTDEILEKAIAYGKKGTVFGRYQKLKGLEDKALILEPIFSVNKTMMEEVITASFSELEGAAVDATIKRVDGQFVITDGKAGIKVDLKASMDVIEKHFDEEWEYNGVETIQLVTTVDEPNITKEQLQQVKDLLGTFSTSFNNRNNRGKNITHAASRINGTLLLPGEEMSASDSMGSRNAENGYLEAGSYLNGTTVQTYGGGVCQVSSTLYNAVLLADLEITERHPHSMLVDYVNPAMDAAISEGSKDLKFKNNTDAPIYVEGYTNGGKLVFAIYGKKANPNRTVSYVHEVLSTKDPGKKFVASNDPIGTMKKTVSAHTGMKAKLWKVVTENGVEVSRTVVNNSSYGASPATYSVGIATDNAQAKSIVTSAIATQNEAQINAAIAQAKALIATPPATTTPTTPPADEGASGTGGSSTETTTP